MFVSLMVHAFRGEGAVFFNTEFLKLSFKWKIKCYTCYAFVQLRYELPYTQVVATLTLRAFNFWQCDHIFMSRFRILFQTKQILT